MELRIYQLDAFASAPFKGNPAAVVPLETWLPDETMQAIAEENNLAETAFFVRTGDRYYIRWFTPKAEVDLCGHATLATAAVIAAPRVAIDCRSGEIAVTRDGDRYILDFPSFPPVPSEPPPGLVQALAAEPSTVLKGNYYLCVYESEETVRNLAPNMLALASVDCPAVIVTAPGTDCDFVSRMFAPAKGIPEDPVTGSAHCTLTPYWSQRLNKKQLFARQISQRGGELWCDDRGSRVSIGGHVVKYLEGTISV
jgi:predicted PhzF superfamily epimerase YddE/YHI9